MQTKHRHLRAEDRGVIYRMNKAGKTQTEIAYAIGFSQSTVSKELKRNRGKRGYRHKQADTLAQKRKEERRSRPRLLMGKLREEVEDRLGKKHSPQQISGSLSKVGIRISHQTIYTFIMEDKKAGGSLHKHLRINGKRRYRRRLKAGRVGKIPNRVDIDDRPMVVETRGRYGDWEADLIEGQKGSGFLISLYERKSHLGKLLYIEDKGAETTAQGIMKILGCYKVETITYDNGLEFSKHVEVSEALECEGYFCKPYHSWEKGGVENFNGLVRQYYPKGSDFSTITPEDLQRVEREINQRPRKTLGYQSPEEIEPELAA